MTPATAYPDSVGATPIRRSHLFLLALGSRIARDVARGFDLTRSKAWQWISSGWVRAGLFLGLPGSVASILGIIWLFLPAPTANPEVQSNFRQVNHTLVQGTEQGLLDIEPAKYWLKRDRMLVYFVAEARKTLIDVFFPLDLNKVRISEIAPEKLYVVFYPFKTSNEKTDYRISLYDLHDGLKTATIFLSCNDFSYEIKSMEIANVRFRRGQRELSFDVTSECDSISNSVGAKIDFKQTREVHGRVIVQLDDSLIVESITSVEALRAAEDAKVSTAAQVERMQKCFDSTVEEGAKRYGKTGGWVALCGNYDVSSLSGAVGRVTGSLVYFNGNLDSQEPGESTYLASVFCDLTSMFGFELSDDGQTMTLFCPQSYEDFDGDYWVAVGQDISVRFYDRDVERLKFKIGCECTGVEIRNMKVTNNARVAEFELAADNGEISVNGTPYTLGNLPENHKKGEPFNWGRFALEFSEGGLVQSFGPVN